MSTATFNLHGIMVPIARAINETWEGWRFVAASPRPRYEDEMKGYVARLVMQGEDGMVVELNAWPGSNNTRISVDGTWPYYLGKGPDDYGRGYPKVGITVGRDRKPDEIGRDIARRFLPAYAREYGQLKAAMDRYRECHRRRIATINRFRQILDPGSTPYPDNDPQWIGTDRIAATGRDETAREYRVTTDFEGEVVKLEIENLDRHQAEDVLTKFLVK